MCPLYYEYLLDKVKNEDDMKKNSIEVNDTYIKTKSDKTKYALIMAGIDLFGEYGFNDTSTRMLSKKSGANISAIPYYFINKEGLYLAVIDFITERMSEPVLGTIENIEKNIRLGKITKDMAKDNIKILLNALAKIFIESEDAKKWVLIVMREQLRPTDAFDKLYNGIMKKMHFTICSLAGICFNKKHDDRTVIVRVHSLIGQVLVFLFSRELLLRRLDSKSISSEDAKIIYQVLDENVDLCLNV